MHNDLSKRQPRNKINHSCSAWSEILFGAPQGSILGSILINISRDLFVVMKDFDFADYAHDDTISDSAESLDNIMLLSSCDYKN